MTFPYAAVALAAIPAAGMLCFYSFDWRVAVCVIAFGRFVWWHVEPALRSRRFPVEPGKRRLGSLGSRVFAPAFYGAVVVVDAPDLLRLFPVVYAVVVVASFLLNRPGSSSDSGRFGGIALATAAFGFAVVISVLAYVSEMIWRFGSFDAWMWLFAFWPLPGVAVAAMLVVPLGIWVDAGEPGRNKP